ncbi:MAG: hypothetical protein EOP38_19650 [Rubrivivax sp.]|nr:MAG: hypothetical protein EOP38_19650 [Rubrivivax sp.]
MKLSQSFSAAILIFAAAGALASPTVTAKVAYTGTYGDGRLFIALNTAIAEPGCPLARFDVPQSHPQAKAWLAIAMAAAMADKSVVLQTNGCLLGIPTMSTDSNSFFYLQN